MKIKKYVFVFLIAFFLNLIWENLHSFLYIRYQGEEITQFILLRAAFFDAVIVTVIVFLLRKFPYFIIPIGIAVAIFIEYHAFLTFRWSYKDIMPIIPILKTGLSPTIQLGLTAFLSYKVVISMNKLHNKE